MPHAALLRPTIPSSRAEWARRAELRGSHPAARASARAFTTVRACPRDACVPEGTFPLAPNTHDELVDASGCVRPVYRAAWPIIRDMTKEEKARLANETAKHFADEYVAHPIPRILGATEAKLLTEGVQQRARALQMFLRDHHSGERSYTAVIPKHEIDRIVDQHFETGYEGLVDPDNITFWYGPDLMRTSDGRFRIVEDNLGYIGGPEDLIASREALFDAVPSYREVLQPLDDPRRHFEDLVAQARRLSTPTGGKLVFFGSVVDADHHRLSSVLETFGVESLTPYSPRQLRLDKDGAWVLERDRDTDGLSIERVGYIFFRGEHRWTDRSHPVTRDADRLWTLSMHRQFFAPITDEGPASIESLMERDPVTGQVDMARLEAALGPEGQAVFQSRTSLLPGLMDATFARSVGTNYTPGIDFITNKELKSRVDELIRFYLDEEPLLTSIPTQSFTRVDDSGKRERDDEAIERCLGGVRYKRYVFKESDGRAGYGVFIGPKMSRREAASLREKITASPGRYIVEPYERMSTVDGHIVDLRVFAAVGPDGIFVAPTPWGRGAPIDSSGKVNIHQQGRVFPVVVTADP